MPEIFIKNGTEKVPVTLRDDLSFEQQVNDLADRYGAEVVLVDKMSVAEQRRLDSAKVALTAGTLAMSTRHDPEIRIKGNARPITEIVMGAFARSGRTVEQWNALLSHERELWIDKAIADMQAKP